MNGPASEWVRKAENDLATARREMAVDEGGNLDAVAFHAQQCAEKFIKAVLQQGGTDFPKTHNLLLLARLCEPPEPRLLELEEELGSLSVFAAEIRYPGTSVDPAGATAALESARRVREICLDLLGLES